MRNVCLGLPILAALILVPVTATLAGTPDLVILEGSKASIDTFGGDVEIAPQPVPMALAEQAGFDMRSLGVISIPRYEAAFEEYVELHQNQELQISIDPGTGAATAEFPFWVIDFDGNRVELDMSLTTGVIPQSVRDCSNFPFCIGVSGDPDYCSGAAWDDQTGDVRLVGVVLVPSDSELTIECAGISIELNANLSPDDTDNDNRLDILDNCPDHYNATQVDDDADGIGNVCDNCPNTYNPTQHDDDDDGAGNSCDPLNVNFQPPAFPVPSGYVKDSGAPYSPTTGRGWLTGTTLQSRDRATGGPDPRLETFVFDSIAREWEATLPPASYDLALSVGDAGYAFGPHRVLVEGGVVFDSVDLAAGEHAFANVESVIPPDGRLTVEIGGGGGYTMLNYIDIVEAGSQPFHGRFINFQPSGYPIPDGYDADSGMTYDSGQGYGWEIHMGGGTRDRGAFGDPVLDTLIVTWDPQTWNLDLPGDLYDVVISVGDSAYAMGPHRVVVEGETWLEAGSTAAGEFITLEGRVMVLDESLTVTIGGGGGFTLINYATATSLPRDIDDDGASNLTDNCIDIFNPGQEDSDQNGVGDICDFDTDGDGHPDPLDNCPAIPNQDQLDTDGDDHGNVCDCAPSNVDVFAPAIEVAFLRVGIGPGIFSTLLWSNQNEESGPGTGYDLAGGMLSDLHADGGFSSAICVGGDLTFPTYQDQRPVPSGDGFYYLVRGENECSPPGTYGVGDAGARATLDSSGPCP